MKFKIVSEKYFNFAKKTIKYRTYLNYMSLYEIHLACVFDERKITSINEDDIENFIESKNKLADSSIKLILCVFKNIINFARDILKIKINLVIRHKLKCSNKEVEPLTKNEQSKIEQFILSNKICYKYGIILSLYTGLRIGELLALTWEDINFKQKTIVVDKTLCTVSENKKTITYIDTPKSDDSERVIPLPSKLIPLLKELQEYQNHNSKYVISSNAGKQTRVRVYQRSFDNLLKKLKIRHYGFHSLRHTFATRAIECGCDVKSLSKILGHADITITLKTYVYASIELKNRLIEKVGKSLKI